MKTRTITQSIFLGYAHLLKKAYERRSLLWRLAWIISFLLTVWSFYPGHMNYESFLLLKQARSEVFVDSHSAIMLFLWRYLDMIKEGPLLMLLAQLLLYFFSVFTIIKNINNNNHYSYRNHFKIFTFVLLLFFPCLFPSLGLISSNQWMIVFLCLGFAHYLNQTHRAKHQKYIYLLFSLTAYMLAVLFQANAVSVVFLLMILNFYDYFQRSFRKCFFMAMLISAFFLSNVILVNYFFSGRDRMVDARLEFYDLAGISLQAKKSLFKNALYAEKGWDLSLSEIEKNYSSSSNIKLFFSGVKQLPVQLEQDEFIELFWFWLHNINSYPREYLSHRLSVAKRILGLGDGPLFNFYRRSPLHKRVYSDLNFEKTSFNSTLRGLYPIYERFKQKPVIKPINYFVLNCLFSSYSFFLLFVRFRGKISSFPQKYLIFMMISLSGVLFQMSFFFTGQSANFQYSLWMIFSALLCLVLIPSQTRFLSD